MSNKFICINFYLKNQVLDDAAKRTRLSHKFSLTEASTFSWQGREVGTRGVIVTTLR